MRREQGSSGKASVGVKAALGKGRADGARRWHDEIMPAVRRFEAGDAPAAAAIIRGLPDYFTDDVPAQVERDYQGDIDGFADFFDLYRQHLADHRQVDFDEQIERDAAGHQAWVLSDSGAVAGLVVAARKAPGGAEILWIAIDAARRGRGYGTRLLGHVLDHLAADGISVVEAKTLDQSSGDRPYEATRAFWERNGFIHIDTIDPLPGWQPGNPAAIYVAAVRPTR